MSGDNGDRLIWSVKNGDLSEVKGLLESGADAKALVNGRGLIHYAADYGQTDVLELLASRGADVNLPDKYGVTPLLAAIFEGHVACVKSLLKLGAKKSGTAPDGRSYVDSADNESIKALLR